MIDERKKELISFEVIKVLISRFANFPENSDLNRNAPFHEAFLRAFSDKLSNTGIKNPASLITLSSWLHGLNTTLGQTFFENTAHILSDGEKREFTKAKRNNFKILSSQQVIISGIITDLKNSTRKPDKEQENELIFSSSNDDEPINALDFTADNYVEDNNSIEAIEIKSVRPNAGQMKEEKTKILTAKAAFKLAYPDKKIDFYIGFPFDPLSDSPCGYDKARFMNSIIEMNKFFDETEILIADEFWNKLSGTKNTMAEILQIINNIASTDFLDNLEFINNYKNFYSDNSKYINILNKWHLYSEIKLAGYYGELERKAEVNTRLQRTLNLHLFKNNEYNKNRFEILNKFIEYGE